MTDESDVVAPLQAAEAATDGHRSNYTKANARVEYCLTFDRCAPRTFYPNEMHGPDIPDAFANRFMPGEWYDGTSVPEDDPAMTEEKWFARFAKMAVNESVHEALEWLKVDGKPWLNPHGESERAIYDAVNKLCTRLAAIAAKERQDAAQPPTSEASPQ